MWLSTALRKAPLLPSGWATRHIFVLGDAPDAAYLHLLEALMFRLAQDPEAEKSIRAAAGDPPLITDWLLQAVLVEDRAPAWLKQ